ncbi:MAG: glycosyltransferase 87 family protein [Candidatus Zixiibacteriota bacterium]
MKRILTAVGISLAGIWLSVTLISLGIPGGICEALNGISCNLFSGAFNNMANGFYYDVPNTDMPTAVFMFLFSLAFFLYLFVVMRLLKTEPGKGSFFIVIFFSIIFRLVLLPSIPVHENDIYRYLWDGKAAKNGINPYKYEPGILERTDWEIRNDHHDMDRDVFIKGRSLSEKDEKEVGKLKALKDDNPDFFRKIGHKWVPTIYPPVAQLIFFAINLVKENSIILAKSVFVFFDLLVLFVISRILVVLGKSPAYSMIYGWSPLVLKEVANSGHYDPVPIFFALSALFLMLRKKNISASFMVALAALAKFFPALLALVGARKLKFKGLFIFSLVFIGAYIPFFVWGSSGPEQVFKGFLTYSNIWNYNGSIFVLVNTVIDAFVGNLTVSVLAAKMILAVILMGIIIKFSRQKCEQADVFLHRCFMVLVCLFLFSPVADPWYFLWVLPFLCFFPYKSFLLLSWLLIFSYFSFRMEVPPVKVGFIKLPLLNLVQYIPFYTALCIEAVVIKRKKERVNYVEQQKSNGGYTCL